MITTGIAIALIGGLLQGSFAIFLKHRRAWMWENFWLVYSFTALLVFPIVWAGLSVPHFVEVIRTSASSSLLLTPMILGGLWGIGSILFGLSVERIGMALSFTIVVGLSNTIGTIVPVFLNKTLPDSNVLWIIAFGLLVMITGISLSGYSGFLREKIQKAAQEIRRDKTYLPGLIMAILSGIFSPMNNIGFAYGSGIGAITATFGASPSNATLPIMVVVFFGGFLVNACYVVFLLKKNKSLGRFTASGTRPLIGSVAAGIFWFGGIGLYGMATAYLGNLGTSVGYAVFAGSVIIVSNLLGVATGEWSKTPKALAIQIASMLVLIAGVAAISLSLFVR